MRDLAFSDRTDIGCLECRDGRGLPVERQKLDLEGLAAPMNVDYDAYVPGLEAELPERFCENDLLVLAGHDLAADSIPL